MWGGVRDEVLLDCEPHQNIKVPRADVGLDVGLKFTTTVNILKIDNNFSRNGGDEGIRTLETLPGLLP